MKIKKTEYFGIQRKMVSHMTSESWQNIPHVTFIYEPDITAFFEEFKKINNDNNENKKITFNTLMLKVITEGLKVAPIMNSHIEFNKKFITGKIDIYENINISMPTILPNGEMMTINLRDFGNKNLKEMTNYINDIRRRAEKTNLNEAMYSVSYDNTIKALKKGQIIKSILKLCGANFGKCKINYLKGKDKKEYESIPETERLTIEDFEPGTVVVSNTGSLYKKQKGATSLLEIIPPMATAFSIGAIQDRAVVIKKENGEKSIEPRLILPICIAFDHRVLDFGDIVPFIKKLDEIFENPKIINKWF